MAIMAASSTALVVAAVGSGASAATSRSSNSSGRAADAHADHDREARARATTARRGLRVIGAAPTVAFVATTARRPRPLPACLESCVEEVQLSKERRGAHTKGLQRLGLPPPPGSGFQQ